MKAHSSRSQQFYRGFLGHIMAKALIFLWALLAWTSMVAAQDAHMRAQGSVNRAQLATTATFDPRGRLWIVWAEGQHVMVSHSDDFARTLSNPVPINPMPEPIYSDGENRPKVIASSDGALYVTYSMPLDKPYTGMVRFSRSADGGESWTVPVTIHRDRQAITHRFDSISVDAQGRVFVTWIDKRDLVLAKQAGRTYNGAAVYYAISTDHGASFQVERKLADHSCECCRIAVATDQGGKTFAMWRNVFDGQIRDHALAQIPVDDAAPHPIRATFSNWKIEACPEHGPSLVITEDGIRHLAWFANMGGKPNIYYSRLSPSGEPKGEPWAFGSGQSSHPFIFAHKTTLWLAWKHFDGVSMRIAVRHSENGGVNWSEPEIVAQTSGASDHPQLLSYGDSVFLSWRTQNDGYQFISLAGEVK
jgi:hypothetical protein